MVENYKKFITELQNMIDADFAQQAPYIKCQNGCAKCCQKGDYPFSTIELEFLKELFIKLKPKTQAHIKSKIKSLLHEKSQSNDETFMHECPFLINNSCSVYSNRGIICRTFGLIYYKPDGKMQIPFCAYDGLNYSEVLDLEKNIITQEKVDKAGYNIEPKSFNIHYDFVTADNISSIYGFNYGKKGPLLEIIADDEFFA